MPTQYQDIHFLHHALRLSARGLGRTWPNPSVGCVLVKNGVVLAAAVTADTGRPHAETQALAAAGGAARGATAYVTLEPCAHHGQTPPCAQALIDAGIARVVVAAIDPDPRVSGQGMAMLEAAGVAVEKILLPEAARLHRGFFKRLACGLPYVAMKLATSLDGHMADEHGTSQWITGPAARAHGHALRAQFDAVVTGIGTVLADDPQLTVRLPGLPHARLVRVVCDRRLRLPLDCQLVRTAEHQPTWVITTAEAIEQVASHATDLREAGVKFLVLEGDTPASHILRALGAEGITRVLVEAGPALSTAFLAARAVETLHWYHAPILLGNTGAAAISGLHTALADAARAQLTAHVALGGDHCDIYELSPCSPD
jgi:diaminohydroxyphosphoribosylaminopyrimidine deaminase/5-amino-6-(5-phosphoribosylamino)uracil reductase